MSAIAGIVSLDGAAVDTGSVERMIGAMRHRGEAHLQSAADGSAVFVWFAGFGPWRAAPAPVHIGSHMLLTADVRIDNRPDLRDLVPSVDTIDSDVELVGEIWRCAGREGLARLAGDFTLAIWNGESRRLVCARDHLGVRPLYYHATPHRIFFSTELRSLLALPGIPHTIDEEMIARYLGSIPRPSDATFFREIRRLPPAHILTADPGGARVERYWDFDPYREITFATQDGYDEAFREQFTAAVACRFDGGSRTGSMLSGGLDSSSISAVARRLAEERGERLQTFSIIFPSYERCDERPWIGSLVEEGDIDPTYVEGDRIAPLAGLGETLEYLEEPLDAPNLFLHDAMYRAARERGLDSILDGLDGDTTVSHGMAYLAELASAGRLGTLWREIGELAHNNGGGRAGILWRRGLKPLLPGTVRGLKGRLGSIVPAGGSIVPDPAFASRTGYHELVRGEHERNLQAELHSRLHHYRKLSSTAIPEVLEIADVPAGRAGVEPRYPFFDRRLVELCLAFPGEQKLHAGWTRFILRNALGGILPEKIRWRWGKANLGHNFVPSLLRHERESLAAIVRSPGPLAGYIDPKSLDSAYARYLSAPSNADAGLLWKALALDHWLKGRSGGEGAAGT